MGYSYGVVNGKEVGYSVVDICNHEGCNKKIDRGMAYACGGDHGEGEYSCDGYFCYEHLNITPVGQLCDKCCTKWEATGEGQMYLAELRERITG